MARNEHHRSEMTCEMSIRAEDGEIVGVQAGAS